MRKISIVLLGLVLGGAWGCEKAIDVEAEKSAIKKVIEAEITTFFARDLEAWEKSWAHEPYSLKISSGKNNFFEYCGWDSMRPGYKEGMDKYPEPMKVDWVKENYIFRIWKDAAWVIYEQYTKDKREIDPTYVPFRVCHVLEKTADGWKIIYMGIVYRNSYRESESETSPN